MQLELPVRIRLRGLHGMRLELARTIDVGREGLFVECGEEWPVGTRIWVTYPYERAMSPTSLAETAARVVRTEPLPEGRFRAALHFDLPRKAAFARSGTERRASQRVYAAVPVFVRPLHRDWPDECMTQDLSRTGMRFETFQSCAPGDLIFAKVHWGEWAQAGEIPGRVLRVHEMTGIPAPQPTPVSNAAGEQGQASVCFSMALHWMKALPQSAEAAGV